DTIYRVPYRAIDGNDVTHRVTLSGVYLLPVGRGRKFFPSMNRVVDGAVGGWELGSLYIYQTGVPWAIPGNPNEVYLHSAYVKPHIRASDGYIRLVAACSEQFQEVTDDAGVTSIQLKPMKSNWDSGTFAGDCPNGADFQQVPNYGRTPNTVYSGIRLPRNQQFDANLSKNFQLYNRMKLQVRLEAFNVLNHPLWSEQPDNSTNDGNFGLITRGPSGQSNLPRQLQLSAKIVW
ncbi:MAG TPA: TonB-dependent receptor, partial [Acidobacteriaceae bacterium]